MCYINQASQGLRGIAFGNLSLKLHITQAIISGRAGMSGRYSSWQKQVVWPLDSHMMVIHLLCGVLQALKIAPRQVFANYRRIGKCSRQVLHSHLDCGKSSCIGTAGLLAH